MSGYQFRGHPWPHKIEGHGGPVEVEYYPFQGLDLNVVQEPVPMQQLNARHAANVCRAYGLPVSDWRRAGELKYPGRSPWGTPLALIARTGGDILTAPCGYCGLTTSRCAGKCGMTGEANA